MRPKQIQGFRCREFGDGLQDLGPAGTRYRWRSSCPGGKSKHRMLCAQRTSGTGLGGLFLCESHLQVFCRSISLTLRLLVRLPDQVLLDLDYRSANGCAIFYRFRTHVVFRDSMNAAREVSTRSGDGNSAREALRGESRCTHSSRCM